MNRVYLTVAAAILWAATPITPASGALLSEIVTFNGREDVLHDNSVGTILDGAATTDNRNGELGVGDFIVTVVHLNTNTTEDISIQLLGEVDIVFVAAVTGVTYNPGGDYTNKYVGVTLGTASGKLQELLGTHAAKIASDDAFAILTSGTPGSDVTSQSYDAAFVSLNGYQLEATGKIAGSNPYGNADIFEAVFKDANADGKISLYGEYTDYLGSSVGAERGGFTYSTIFGSATLAGLMPLPVSLGHLFDDENVTKHGFSLGGSLSKATASGWFFADNSDLKTNLTPEPGTIVGLIGMLVVGGAAWGVPRKQRD